MLFRLVRPLKRPGSSIPQFVQRIPADVRARAVGVTLAIPVGSTTVRRTISATTESVRLSLQTREPAEAKIRQATITSYLETVWRALRQPQAVSLTNREATALAGELYRAWADGEGREKTIAIELTPQGNWVPATVTPEEEGVYFKSAAKHLASIRERADSQGLEAALGAIVDSLLLAKGIASVDDNSRLTLLKAFHLALQDALELRERNAGGDYSPDPKAARFPEWAAPSENPKPPRSSAPTKGVSQGHAWGVVARSAGDRPKAQHIR